MSLHPRHVEQNKQISQDISIIKMNLIIFGAPGSGKGTQSERLIARYGLHHISTGDVLRSHIARGTENGKIADTYISKGQLLPDELMVGILADELDANAEKVAKGVIFDGFPRTIPQAHALKDLLEKRGMKIDAVVGLEVPEDELIERLVKRGIDSGRSDDNPETIKKRIDVYHEQTHPLRDFYVGEGSYKGVHGTGSIDDIADRIVKALES